MKVLGLGLPKSLVGAVAAEGHLVVPCGAADVDEFFEYLDCESPGVALVDVDAYPWLISTIKTLRHRGVTVPIVGIVSPNCQDRRESRAEFLESGGNDLLEKPAYIRELIMSIDSLYRLHTSACPGRVVTADLGYAVIRIDTGRQAVTVDNQKIALTPMEYKLLELLILHKGQTVKRKFIDDTLYGFLDVPDNNSVEVLLTRIRKKMAAVNPGAKEAIETIRAVGYRFNEA